MCVSQGAMDHCRVLGYPAGKLTAIPNGVDYRQFAEAKPIELTQLGLPAGQRAILFVGRLDRQKGLDDLLANCPRVLAALPQHDLVLVGDGPERAALKDLAAARGIAGRVHFAGWRADVPEILAAADLLVLPSRWEGMPNVVLEAMAAGKPVVATRAHGVEDALGELAKEQCVPVGNGHQLAERIIHFAQNPQLACEIGSAKPTQSGGNVLNRCDGGQLRAALCVDFEGLGSRPFSV